MILRGKGERAMSNFSYTSDEITALAECVPRPDFLDELSPFGRLVSFPDHEHFRVDKKGYIDLMLTRTARECLEECRISSSLSETMDEVLKITQLCSKLRSKLRKSSFYRPTNAIAFLGIDYGWKNFDGEVFTPSHEVLDRLLTEVLEASDFVTDNIKSYHDADPFLKTHSPAFARYVSQVLCFWRVWTNSPPGAGKQGGPAARLLMSAANPVIAFAERNYGISLRRAGKLDEGSAGELIAQHKRQQKKEASEELDRCGSPPMEK